MASIITVENGKNGSTAPLFIVRGPYPSSSQKVISGKAGRDRKRTLRKRRAAGKKTSYVSYQQAYVSQ